MHGKDGYDSVNDVIARRLTNLRKSKGLSQSELSEKIGISRQTISKWERGVSLPGVDNLTVLASFYELDAEKIMSLTEDELSSTEAEKTGGAEKQEIKPKKSEKPAGTKAAKQTKKEVAKPETVVVSETAEAETPSETTPEPAVVDTDNTPEVVAEVVEEPKEKVELPSPVQTVHQEIKSEKDSSETDAKQNDDKPRKRLLLHRIPFSICIVIAYLLLGFTRGLWHPGWLIFLLIPIWESTLKAIEAKSLDEFEFPVLAVFAFLFMGFVYPKTFHPTWLIFLTIPIYYAIVKLGDE